MTFDPEQNRVQTGLLTEDERAALKDVKHGWQRYRGSDWIDTAPSWAADGIYRAKPAPAPTIIVNGIEVPEPVREELVVGQRYFTPVLNSDNFRISFKWCRDEYDNRLLNRGLIHLTEEAAVAHAKAMLAPSMRGDV